VKSTTAHARTSVPFQYHSFRNISSPEDVKNNRKVFTGHAPVLSVLPLSTDENVRAYLLEAEGKLRRRETQVNQEIRETLENHPEDFPILNSGIVIVARDHLVDEQQKMLSLVRPSIINGSQTQGVLKDHFQRLREAGLETPNIHVKYELIVTNDEDLIAEVSIARNFQNDVANISIAGRRGYLDELEASMQKRIPGTKLQKSETQLSEDYISTERLLQVITALIPADLWPKAIEAENPNKVYTYSMKAKCLKEFQEIFQKAHDKKHEDYERTKALYQFYLDIAPVAYELYDKWKTHQGFAGTGIRSITRQGREIVEVPDGLVFPILASLSVFAKHGSQGWKIDPPKVFKDEEIIRAAKYVYQNVASSNPWIMGKSKACYAQLYQITSIYKQLSQ
jgi:hypothetical protein